MKTTPKGLARTCSALVLAASAACARGGGGGEAGLAPARVADYVHAVIAADRATYAEEVVHRLQDVDKVVRASEQFKEEKSLPLPSQMLRMGAQRAAKTGGFRYGLISTWAINKANMPRTDFEKRGLEAVAKAPDAPYRSTEEVGGKRYFMSLYPDVAVSEACVKCHNGHAESPRTDFKLNDVMGGVVVALPLE
jgi:hypothetical protein